MTKEHTLKLKIDAGAAETGAKRFKSAINSVKRAVSQLDRDTDGAFRQLKNVDVSGMRAVTSEAKAAAAAQRQAGSASDRAADNIRRTALASANALRTSTDQAARLRDRLLSVGDTAGLAKLDQALARLRVNLTNATSGLDVREARAEYNDLASSMNRTAREAERLRAIANANARAEAEAADAAARHAAEMERLRSKYNPLYSASKQYESALQEIAFAEREGAISAQVAAQARDRAANSLGAASAANSQYAKTARSSSHETAYLAAQFNDIGVMMAAGQNPFVLAMQQGTQVSQMLNQMGGRTQILRGLASGFMSMVNPVSLVTIGVIAAGAAIVQWIGAGKDEVADFASAIGDAESAVSNLRSAVDTLNSATLGTMHSQYGRVNEELRTHLGLMERLAKIEVVESTAAAMDAVRNTVASDGNFLTGEIDAFRRALDTTNDSARRIIYSLGQIQEARTFEEQLKMTTALRQRVEQMVGGLENSEGAARKLLIQLIKSEDNARLLVAAQNGTFESTERASGAASVLAYEIGTAADAARVLLANLSNVPQAVAVLQGSVADQLAGIKASNRSLEIQLSEGLSSAAANRRVQLEDMVKSAANGGPINFDQIAKAQAEIDALDAAAKRRADLQKQLRDANKTDTDTGGSGGRAADLKAVEQLNKSMESRLKSLQAEAIAMRLVNSGQFETEAGARAMAEAMIASGGAVDAQTASMIQQIDAAAALNEQLKKNAEDAVTFQEAMADAAEGVEGNLKSALSDLFATGEMDIAELGNAIRRTFADAAANWVVDRMNIGGLMSGQGGGMGAGGAQAGQQIATSMIGAGHQVAQQIALAMRQGGTGVRLAHIQGGQSAAAATRSAGIMHGQQVRFATTTSGRTHAVSVKSAIDAGAQNHAQAVSGAMGSKGGGGGGLLSLFGGPMGILSTGMSLFGAFSEGGYSDRSAPHRVPISPAAFANAPHYAEGTANTSGIPAVLHPNEAVIPLSRGRKVPVELGGGAAANISHAGHTFNIDVSVEGGEGGEDQAINIAKAIESRLGAMMDDRILEHAQYGGMLNQRG